MEELRLFKHLLAKTDATAGFCGSLDASSHAIFVWIWFPIRSKRRPSGCASKATADYFLVVLVLLMCFF